jgi:hypothetical protein
LASDLTYRVQMSGRWPGIRDRAAWRRLPLSETGARRGPEDQAHSLLAGTSQPKVGDAPAAPLSVWVL